MEIYMSGFVRASEVNELYGRLLSTMSLNPWVGHSSSPRLQMYGGHVGSSLTVEGATPRRCQSGYEQEYGKYTFSKKMPEDAQIIRTFERYPETLGRGGIRENPQRVILYEETQTKRIGVVLLNNHFCIHKDFGFKYKFKNVPIHPKAYVKKDTILADSPAIDEHGNYNYGVEMPGVFLSVPGVAEDAVVFSDLACQLMATTVYGSRWVRCGGREIPLSLYGDENIFKMLPDIGERIRSDGLLFATRTMDTVDGTKNGEIDYSLAIVKMTPKALAQNNVDYLYDKLIYGKPGAKIVDIRVHRSPNSKTNLPVGMEGQVEKYGVAADKFYDNIVKEYERLYRIRGKDLVITNELHQLLIEAYIEINVAKDSHISKTYKKVPIDNDYLIEVIFEDRVVPTVGYKITGCHGDSVYYVYSLTNFNLRRLSCLNLFQAIANI
jgi:hypothetical protein